MADDNNVRSVIDNALAGSFAGAAMSGKAPMPGPHEFTAEQEKQMRANQRALGAK